MASMMASGPMLPQLNPDVTLHLSRLLDMPVEVANIIGGLKGYRIRVFDDMGEMIHKTGVIEGPPVILRGSVVETVEVPPEVGTLILRTVSRVIFVQVEHAWALSALEKPIGVCQIHRMDPRCGQLWPYQLSNKEGVPAECGVELRLIEGLIPGVTPMMPNAMSMPQQTMADADPLHMKEMNHGVVALLEFHRAMDLPPPRVANQDTEVVVLNEEDRELNRVGPLPTQSQQNSRLLAVDCADARLYVQAPVRFGGDAQEGAIYFKLSISYQNAENIGVTDRIKVSWQPVMKQYHELKQPQTGSVIGTICFSYRLVTEAEAKSKKVPSESKHVPEIGPPVEPLMRLSGRTGNYPPGSQEEAFEQAALNCEAQNRALLQRVKMADKKSHLTDPGVIRANGYREWDGLDNLFLSMGPNPVAMSEEIGPSVTRAYQQHTSVMKEMAPRLPLPLSIADEMLNAGLVRNMCKNDPMQAKNMLRPVICKDPHEIAGPRDMRWCPDPPIYAPLKNMTPEDRQTLRLACYEPTQNATLLFADVNPNYRVEKDIWGVLAQSKAPSLMVPKPAYQYDRVKDDCIMA